MMYFLRGLGMIGVFAACVACARPIDYSTDTGKSLFPFTSVSPSKIQLTAVAPETLKLKGFDDIQVSTYAVKVNSTYTARGYLFTSAKRSDAKPGNRILFGHWLGGIQGVDSSEWQFFREAALYAREGNVCVIPSGNYPWMTSSTATAEDVALAIGQVNDYRIGLDILFSESGRQPPKAMVIAHDYGGMFALLAAAADARVGAAVIMAPTSRFYQWNMILRSIPAGEVMDAYQAAMLPYDPVTVAEKVTVPLLFQYAKADQFVSVADAETLMAAAKNAPKEVRWYPTSHNIHRYDAASADRKAWVEGMFAAWDEASTE